ncbi:MAG: cell division protein FtsZ [Bacteroidia bacterium]|nr:cell division protein FtsZ [Bacteroidia bacterium]
MKFDLPKEQSSIIKVIGVGGGGSNAVNHMFKQGITGVNFVICNTDQQALDLSPVPNKVQLGASLTEGMGAGSTPEIGKLAAEESLEDINSILGENTKMVFVTAGMGGGTGTGGAPVIAKAAKDLGLLTVGIVTLPFGFEGGLRRTQALEGVNQLKDNVDSLLIISNDKLKEVYGNLTLSEAFGHADNVLTTAAKGIAEIITVAGYINVDFKDVKKVLTNSGVAIMGSASSEGEDRALRAVELALNSPLLNDNNIIGAKDILLNITSGSREITMDEISQITEYIQDECGSSAEMIWGNGTDESLGEKVGVTVIATGFQTNDQLYKQENIEPQKIVRMLDEDVNERTVHTLNMDEENQTEPELKQNKDKNIVQGTFMFDHSKGVWQKTEFKDDSKGIHEKTDEIVAGPPEPTIQREEVSNEELEQKSQDRINKLKELSMKLRTPSGVTDLEKEPAYVRKDVNLDSVPHSSEEQMSRFTLSNDGDDKDKDDTNLRPNNNSFLHDNVD